MTFFEGSTLHWVLDEPTKLVREHPFRFEKPPSGVGRLRSFYQALEHFYKNNMLSAMCELDTDAELFIGASRFELEVEPVRNYRSYPRVAQIGYDRLESEQDTRIKFENIFQNGQIQGSK